MHGERFELRLFVSGESIPSRRAIESLERMCAGLDDVALEIIDVRDRPDLAEAERIVATPTLIRRSPTPARRLIGDLSDSAAVAASLNLPDAGVTS